jgi:hypothetical protein
MPINVFAYTEICKNSGADKIFKCVVARCYV